MTDIQLTISVFLLIIAIILGVFGGLLANSLSSLIDEILSNYPPKKRIIWKIILLLVFFVIFGALLSYTLLCLLK